MPYCKSCGKLECLGCARAYDPPRFCPECGNRLKVIVSPNSFTASCKVHGLLDDGVDHSV